MKIKFLIILMISLFGLNLYAAEKQDCSVFKKLSKDYLKCKTSNLKKGTKNIFKDTLDFQKKSFSKKNESK